MSTAVSAPLAPPDPTRLRVVSALVAVQVAFGTLPVAGKLAMVHVGPFGLSLVRVSGAALFFGALFLANRRVRIPLGDVLRIAGCGLLGMAANQLLFLGGLERSTATNATVLVTTIPVFTFLVALALRQERATWRGALGLVLAFAGVLALVKVERFELASGTLVGDAMIVTNAFCYALYLVLVKPYLARYGTLPIVAIGFFASMLAVLPFGLPQLGGVLDADAETWGLLLYVVAVPTLLTYLLNAWALRYASSSTVAIFIYLQPIVGLALAVAILHEQLGTRAALGTLAVFVGIALVTFRRAASKTR
ncbi:MAG: DMT family transporter [Sandaracinus sp.]|nr:DMT family transporter [Sandaracinus sp.]MCB9622175.1 DMT family transporter [Sandaracinus sp.]